MTMRPVSRRALLRGSGVAMALPLLECMLQRVRGAPASVVPKRAAVSYTHLTLPTTPYV